MPLEETYEETPRIPYQPIALLERSQTCAAIALALAKAQSVFTDVEKNCTAEIPTKAGGRYSFDYADLAAIRAATSPGLTANGLALLSAVSTEDLGGGWTRVRVQTELVHESGEWFRTPVLHLDVASGDSKLIGGASTYFRRYQVQNLLGVAAEDDKDADGAGQRKETVRSAPPPGAGAGRFTCRQGHKHATADEAKTCGAPPAERTLEPGEDPPAMSAPPRAGELPVLDSALAAKDWRRSLSILNAMPEGPEKQAARDAYNAARYGQKEGSK